MYKALQLPESIEVNLLSRWWIERTKELRYIDRADRLVCPGCRQPVRVRVCVHKRTHFAHKHLQNCPYQFTSPELLHTRAVLYERLVNQFGEACVTIEKVLPDTNLPRQLDAWVSQPNRTWGYWIIDRRMPPDERELLLKITQQAPGPVHFIFAKSLLHNDEKDSHRLYLTTTEREFMHQTIFDAAWQNVYDLPGQTLHYLDASTESLLTYRSLTLVHRPQLYAGHPLSHPLEAVEAIPDEGGWRHPDEEQRVNQHLSAFTQRQQMEVRLRAVGERLQRRAKSGVNQAASQPAPNDMPTAPSDVKPEPGIRQPFQRTAACRMCGQITTDWVSYDGRSNTCVCRDCTRKIT